MDLKKTLILPYTSFEMRGNLNQKEPLIIAQWTDLDIYHQANAIRNKTPYILHDGPPYANGKLHTGHMLNRFLKDFVIRFKNMQGYPTPIRYGWDTHGLPIENVLTKNGVKWREIGIAKFREMCREYALTQVAGQKATALRLGTMWDVNHPYITLEKEYEANQIMVFAHMAAKGLIYKGLKPVYWSPSSETALADAEIEYHDVESDAIFVAFTVIHGNEHLKPGDKLVIWTTTPWTIPANLALCLNPEFTYGVCQTECGRLVLLEKLASQLQEELGLKEFKLLSTFKGGQVEYLKAKHPFYDRESLIINGRHVSDDAGTGIVHTAPGHGLEDYNVSLNYGLEPYCPVDSRGNFDETVGPRLAKLFYEKGNSIVIEMLKESDSLLKSSKITHSYPHDWRTKKPLIFRATAQWFCSIDPIRQELLSAVETIEWYNSWSKTRMLNMIRDRGDWCISRQRVWGVPIPMLICEDGTPIMEMEVFQNIAQEFLKHGSNIWFEKDADYFLPAGYQNTHSPHNLYTKEKDIMDVWFDSGSSFEAVIKKDGMYPADLYFEGSDQYRGWFNSSLILSVALNGIAPFKGCISHGFIVDQSGQKMSKSLGNTLDPQALCEEFGADILRLWAALSDFTQDVHISHDLIKKTTEVYKKIRNTFRFMLGNLANGDLEQRNLPFDPLVNKVSGYTLIDEIVLMKFHSVKNNFLEKFATFDFINALNPLIAFFSNELSSFYLDIAKDVLYCDALNSLRRSQMQNVIYEILTTTLRLLFPILPFTMEEVNNSLTRPLARSVQYLNMPEIEASPFQDKAELASKIFTLRENVFVKLEELRQEKLIGSGLDANVMVILQDQDLRTALAALEDLERARIFGVSRLDIIDEAPLDAADMGVLKVEKAEIYVMVSAAPKCERCWNHREEIIEYQGHKICPRCYTVLKEKENHE